MKKDKNKQVIVIGLGRFGGSVAKTLCDDGYQVLGIDVDADVVDDFGRVLTQTIRADTTDIDVMRALGVNEFDTAFVTIGGDVQVSCVTTMLLKELGIKKVIAKAKNEFHGRMLEKLGADRVVYPERDMGRRIGHNFASGNLLEFLELSPDFSMAEIGVKKEWSGHTLKELDLRGKYQVNIVAVRSEGKVNAMPNASTVLQQGDILLVVTASDTMQNL